MGEQGRKRIVSLRWEETSGVDHPANLAEGWLVMKQAGGAPLTDAELEAITELEEVLDEDDELHKAHERLRAVLGDSATSLKEAPADVKEAVATLIAYLDKTVGKAADTPEDPKPSRAERAASSLLGILRLRKRRIEGAEQQMAEVMEAVAPGLLALMSDRTLTKAQRLRALDLVEQRVTTSPKEGE